MGDRGEAALEVLRAGPPCLTGLDTLHTLA
jgi:hypothetical protein